MGDGGVIMMEKKMFFITMMAVGGVSAIGTGISAYRWHNKIKHNRNPGGNATKKAPATVVNKNFHDRIVYKQMIAVIAAQEMLEEQLNDEIRAGHVLPPSGSP